MYKTTYIQKNWNSGNNTNIQFYVAPNACTHRGAEQLVRTSRYTLCLKKTSPTFLTVT